MIGQGRPRQNRVSLIAAGCIVGAATAGCATLRTQKPGPEPPQPKRIAMRPMEIDLPATQKAQPPSHDEREQATLDAVEQFLARTEEYGTDAHAQEARARPRLSAETQQADLNAQAEPEIRASKIAPEGGGRTKNRAIANAEISLTNDGTVAAPSIQAVAIRPPKTAPAAAMDTSNVVGTTNKPLEIHANDKPVSVDVFMEALRKAAKKDGDFDAAWRYRVVERAMGRRSGEIDDRALSSSKAKPLLTSMLDTMDAVRSLAHDPLATGEKALHKVAQLQELVAEQADPVVETIAFCRKVVTFGVFEEMGADEFAAGRPVSTIVYSEIRNLSSETDTRGAHRTVFASRMELLTASGQSVWRHEEPEIVDRCSRRRNDFFVAQRVTLPAMLAGGDYVLKVFIEDKLSGKASEATREFTTSSRDTLTARR